MAAESYDTQFGMNKFKRKDLDGDGTITDNEKYADHPRENKTRWGITVDVAGAYQFKSSSWDRVKSKLGLTDFSPENQDKGALQLIRWQNQDNPRARGVIDDIIGGNINQAFGKLNGTWTSLPGGREQLITSEEGLRIFKQNISSELNNSSELAAPVGGATF